MIKSSHKKATKTKGEQIVITVELTPDYEKDYEVIPYNPKEEENQQNIANFMAKYIYKPFTYADNVVGVELNFNKLFYKPEPLRSVTEIIQDLDLLEKKLQTLENSLNL